MANAERTEFTNDKGDTFQLIKLPLNNEGTRNFNMGLGKCKAIVKNLDAIKEFIEEMENVKTD